MKFSNNLQTILNIFGITLFAFILLYAYLFSYTARMTRSDTAKNSDVLLVLGARSYRNGKYNPCLYERVKRGVNLYKSGYAPYLLFSGGSDLEDNINEAETMRQIALELDVPDSAIILEKQAGSTYENMLFSRQILSQNNKASAIIVTEPFHIGRAALVAKKLNMDYSLSPATDSVCWTRWKYISRYMLREPFALMLYKTTGEI